MTSEMQNDTHNNHNNYKKMPADYGERETTTEKQNDHKEKPRTRHKTTTEKCKTTTREIQDFV